MRYVIKLALVVVILLVIAAVVAVYQIDHLARAAIERGGTEALGATTTVDSAHVALLAGETTLDGVKVANPQGFDASSWQVDHFMTMRRGALNVKLKTLMDSTVVAPKLVLEGIDLELLKNGDTSNYQVILKHLKDLESAAGQSVLDQRKFVIRDVYIRDVTVHVRTSPQMLELAKMPPVKIDEIHLTDVGSDTDKGLVMSQLSSVIVQAVMRATVQKGIQLPGEILSDLGNSLNGITGFAVDGMDVVAGGVTDVGAKIGEGIEKTGKEVGGVPGEVIEGVGKGAKTIIEGTGKGVEAVGEGAKKVTEGVGNVIKGVGGLLKGDDKKQDDDKSKDKSGDPDGEAQSDPGGGS